MLKGNGSTKSLSELFWMTNFHAVVDILQVCCAQYMCFAKKKVLLHCAGGYIERLVILSANKAWVLNSHFVIVPFQMVLIGLQILEALA